MKFLIKTKEGAILKTLFETLSILLGECDLEVGEDFGMRSTCMNVERTVLVNFLLRSEKFQCFRTMNCEDFLTINCSTLFEGMKTAKREDSITMSMDRLTVSGKGGSVTTFITTEHSKGYVINLPEGYGRPIVITSSEFQMGCRSLPKCEIIEIQKFGTRVRMVSRTGEIRTKEVVMGEEDDWPQEPSDVSFSFDPLMIRRIGSKIANIGGSVSLFFATKDEPLLIRTNVGTLGEISFYVKPLSKDPPGSTSSNDRDRS